MKISINKKNKDKLPGFTIIELVVVIAGLAALGAFTIPNVLNSIKLSRIEEAKALMNSYASDCLGKYRISTDSIKFSNEAIPDNLDTDKLATLGYRVDNDKAKCSHTAIKPISDDETFLYAFDFRISSEGKLLKTAVPSTSVNALNSCKAWAGKNCGLSEEQKAEFARQEALAKAKATCISNYQVWLSKGNSGESTTWDKTAESCSKKVWAFEGTPVANAEAVEAALKAKYGRKCEEWRGSKIDNKSYISPGGNSETKDPECGGVPYWFHSGKEFTSKADWTEHNNLIAKQACINDRSNALSTNKEGKYVYGPTPGPDPCGKVVWLCNGQETTSLDAYKTTSCGAPPPADPPPVKKKPPKVVKDNQGRTVQCPGSKPGYCNDPFRLKREPACKCWR